MVVNLLGKGWALLKDLSMLFFFLLSNFCGYFWMKANQYSPICLFLKCVFCILNCCFQSFSILMSHRWMYINVELLRHFFVPPVDWKTVEEKGAPRTASVAALETLYRRAFWKCPLVLKAEVLVSCGCLAFSPAGGGKPRFISKRPLINVKCHFYCM